MRMADSGQIVCFFRCPGTSLSPPAKGDRGPYTPLEQKKREATMRAAIGIGTALAIVATGALATSALAMGGWSEGGAADVDNCKNEDGTLSEAAFVIVTAPGAGERVQTGFVVKGCSRTFESTVNWRLVGS